MKPISLLVTLLNTAAFFLFIGILPLPAFAEESTASNTVTTTDTSMTLPSALQDDLLPVPSVPAQAEEQKSPMPSPIAQEPETNPEFRPRVIITAAGEEYNIKVSYDHPMDFSGQNFIEYVRMETLEGEFLGLMTYNDKITKASAEFMLNPKLLTENTMRFVAKSTKVGLIKSIHKLEASSLEEVAKADPNSAKEDVSKKKFLGIF
ncbi:MAG: hypothetical protein EXS63_03180 [Candidatus Omnitrophica bacterium]|nr:hypothetical protein [Candidatus Omnitrophota bacterium]